MSAKKKRIFKIALMGLLIAVMIGVSTMPIFAAGDVSSAIQST